MMDSRSEAEQRERDARMEADLAFLEELEADDTAEVVELSELPPLTTAALQAEITAARLVEAQRRDIAAAVRAPELDLDALGFLSGLTRGETKTLRDVWPTLPAERRRRLVGAMGLLTRDDLDLDFARALRVALRDSEAGTRAAAVAALWEDRALDTLTAFLEMLGRDDAPAVRLATTLALAPFATAAAAGDLPEAYAGRVRDALFAAATDTREIVEVVRAATVALGVFDDADVGAIIEETYDRGTFDDRLTALAAMGRSCNPRYLPTIQDDTEDDERDVRLEATRALGELGAEAGVPEVIARLDDEDRAVRLAAVASLGQIGNRAAVTALREHRADEDTDDWRDATDAALAEAALGDSLIP